jgi:hypothetical protein
LAYIVIEDFPLTDYGNRIPNFNFEVKRTLIDAMEGSFCVENAIKSMVIIPGSGEFVYDPEVQTKASGTKHTNGLFYEQGFKSLINQNNNHGLVDVVVAMDQLRNTCPNLEWVAPTVNWFVTSTSLEEAIVTPAVEHRDNYVIQPRDWQVANCSRSDAHLISRDSNNRPAFGGTPDDSSILRYLTYLKQYNYRIMFYPLLCVDTKGKPWRGHLSGSPKQICDFFSKPQGYNDFILHYANLVKGKVDAFIIGSELVGLTKVREGNNFPAIDALCDLASKVKQILGQEVIITYGADWTEYHHTDGGWYHMDKLWASPNIDVVGIDAYFPLTEQVTDTTNVNDIMKGWTSGEGYDFYYNQGQKLPLDTKYAWKNISWWWENEHYNPNGNKTPWLPKSKKIWFIEYGFPSVNAATNQPNVFYMPECVDSALPKHSSGQIDFYLQRLAIEATERQWHNSPMIERKFLWCWDARPFPVWPDMVDLWSDGCAWATGHWVNGKLGISSLAAIIRDLCLRAGINRKDIDTSRLSDNVDGFVINNRINIRTAIETLQKAYFFSATENSGVLTFAPYTPPSPLLPIDTDSLVNDRDTLLNITCTTGTDIDHKIDVVYLNKAKQYEYDTKYALLNTNTGTVLTNTLDLPIVLSDISAQNIAKLSLLHGLSKRLTYHFRLPMTYVFLEAGDVITLVGEYKLSLIIDRIMLGNDMLEITGHLYDPSICRAPISSAREETPSNIARQIAHPNETKIIILDLPILTDDVAHEGCIYLAASADFHGWRGADVYYSVGEVYEHLTSVSNLTTMGKTVNALTAAISCCVLDEHSELEVIMQHGEIENISTTQLMQGKNLALIGEELVQFRSAKMIAHNHYILSGFLRGCYGTEHSAYDHKIGEQLILISSELTRVKIPSRYISSTVHYKVVSSGQTEDKEPISYMYKGRSFMPYTVGHISSFIDAENNIHVKWIGRSRIEQPLNGYITDGQDELYEAEITNQDGTIIRKFLNLKAPYFCYTKEMQLADHFPPLPQLKTVIYQISPQVGRGVGAVHILQVPC